MLSNFRVVHVVAGLHPRQGGPSRTVVQLADAIARHDGISVTLISQSLLDQPTVSSAVEAVNRRIIESPSPLNLLFGLNLREELIKIVRNDLPVLFHAHGLWLPVNHWTANIARITHIPLVVHTHGMLEKWALNHKAWKKRFAWSIFQRRDLEYAKVLIATSVEEYESLRRFGIKLPIAIISNGINKFSEVKINREKVHRGNEPRTALFLSRVHPVKGLSNLIRAWAQVPKQGWILRIAGPDEGGYIREVMAQARQLFVEDSIEYIGEVSDKNKSALYRDADLFVLPTFTENFGVVVAEALAHGVPVITTRGAPWSGLEIYRCGWWVELGVEPLAAALREGMSLSDENRRQMGERGLNFVRQFDWEIIAIQMIEVYRWVLGKQAKPDCVRIN